MKRTSVLLEFSDGVYDTLVEPLKKNRAFSKFLSALVDGYISDPYIRAFADGNLDEFKKASVAAFDEQLDEMSESLANMGFFADELEAMSAGGKAHFTNKAKQHSQPSTAFHSKPEEVSSDETDNKDIKDINARMDRMEANMNAFFTTMMTMLQTQSPVGQAQTPSYVAPNSGISFNNSADSQKSVTPPVVEKHVEKVEKPVVPTSNSTGSLKEEKTKQDTDDSEDSVADDFMSSMLDGNMFVF